MKIDFEKIRKQKMFYNLVNETQKEEVLKLCLENATNEECKYLIRYAKTDEIKELFREKLNERINYYKQFV